MSGEKGWRVGGEDEEECKVVVKMNTNCKDVCVCVRRMKRICNKWTWVVRWIVPEIHFVALLQLKAPARTISVESTLALNPWCFGAKVVYVHTPGTHPPHRKAIYDLLSVLPKLEKSQETQSNTLHMANYCPNFTACTPLTQVPYVPKSLPRALSNIRHLHEWSTSSEGEGQ